MKPPALIAAVERDLKAGHAAVIQIVSTGEALMERRLAEIPTEEWGDVQVDITPREYVLDYLAHGFPTQLFEPFTDGDGNLSSRPVFHDGQPVQCRDAVERRWAPDGWAGAPGGGGGFGGRGGEDGGAGCAAGAGVGPPILAGGGPFWREERRFLVTQEAWRLKVGGPQQGPRGRTDPCRP